jgi:hypothetical protein
VTDREQFDLVATHNWDDGVAAMSPFLRAPGCALEVAVLAYWRLEGPWNDGTGAGPEDRLLNDLSARIARGELKPVGIPYDPVEEGRLSRTQVQLLRKSGVPAIFFGPFAEAGK